MKTTEYMLLRVFVGEGARHGHQSLHEAIVMKAKELKLRGATVLRGTMGFGRSNQLRTSKILDLSDDLPVVIEIVDAKDKIESFIPALHALAPGVLATLESVSLLEA